jgi:23S rRNA pseudouridine1911/1915/1917 synthase
MKEQFTAENLEVVFEDNQIIVVLKPQNVPSCPDETGDTNLLDVVKEYLVKKYNKPGDAYVGLVHRLDRPAGGVMVFAKTSKAAARLCEGMKNGEFEKTYYAVVVGEPREKSVLNLTHYLLKDPSKNMVSAVPMATEGAKEAVLDYTTLDTQNDMSLLAVKLHTGRAHQIRVQLQTVGCPIFGDQKYGEGKSPAGYNLALWATELKFIHPVTKEKMVFRVYPPADEVPWKFFDISRFLSISIKNNY